MRELLGIQKGMSNTVQRRLKGSAMGMAIIISLLIAFVSGYFILRSHLSRIRELRFEIKNNLIQNAESGIQLLVGSPSVLNLNDSIDMDLFGDGNDSVVLKRSPWGMYEILHSRAFCNDQSYSISSLVGNKIPFPSLRTGLYLCDLDKQIGICGNTLLHGVNFIPNDGLKRTYIEGESFSEKKTVQGEEKTSDRFLPEINHDLVQSLRNQLSGKHPVDTELYDFYSSTAVSLYRNFESSTLLLHSNGNILLDRIFLDGKIIVQSNATIHVGANCALTHVVLIAQIIEIEDGFHGNCQFIASHSIEMGNDVNLLYPSTISLLAEKCDSIGNRSIIIGDDCHISGTLVALPSEEGDIRSVKVSTGYGFTMDGEIYVNGDLDLKGQVDGSVLCRKMILHTPSAVYENQLLNVAIRPDLLPEYYAVSALLKNSHRTIMSWL